MSTPDMLKKLLEEFREKESLVREEIAVIYDEIAQLESKLETCKRRLSTLGGDHDKVLSMRQRYVENRFERVYSTPGNGQAAAPAAKPAAPAAKPAEAAPASQAAQRSIPPAPAVAANTQQPAAPQQAAAAKSSVPDFAKPSPSTAPKPTQSEPAKPFPQEQAPAPAQAPVPAAPAASASTAPMMQAQAAASDESAAEEDPGAPPKATLKPGQGVRKNKSALSAILGPLRTAASQLTSNQTPPAPWESEGAPPDPNLPGPSISQTGSYYPGVNVAITDTPPTQELPKPGMLTGNPANDEPQQHQEPQDKPQDKGTTAEPEKKPEDDSDAMKSINDALRSLFR